MKVSVGWGSYATSTKHGRPNFALLVYSSSSNMKQNNSIYSFQWQTSLILLSATSFNYRLTYELNFHKFWTCFWICGHLCIFSFCEESKTIPKWCILKNYAVSGTELFFSILLFVQTDVSDYGGKHAITIFIIYVQAFPPFLSLALGDSLFRS